MERDRERERERPSLRILIFDFSRTSRPISIKLGTNDPWVKGIHFNQTRYKSILG
jgi:hypothetical protein